MPMFMWDVDRNWRAMRREVPWVRANPFESIREHMRFSTTPFEASSAAELDYILRWLGTDDILIYGSDYPHERDAPDVLLEAMPAAVRAKVMAGNAEDWYGIASGAAA